MTTLTTRTLVFDCATNAWYTNKATGAEPKLVRLAWMLEGEEPQCTLIDLPPDTPIDPSTVPYHGVDKLPEIPGAWPNLAEVLTRFTADADRADRYVAFNLDYHHRQLARAFSNEQMTWVPLGPMVCAMKEAAPLVAIPAMKPGGGFKSPKLSEACHHFGMAAPELTDDPILFGKDVVFAVAEIDRHMNGAPHV